MDGWVDGRIDGWMVEWMVEKGSGPYYLCSNRMGMGTIISG